MTHKSVALAEKIHRYEANNLESARMILDDQGRYGGEHSLMVIWAKLVISKSSLAPIVGNLIGRNSK